MRAAAIRQYSDPSGRNHLEKILENELDQLQQRVLETAKGEFLFDVTGQAREFLLLEGSGQHHGAQRLKLAIERHVVFPLADLFATDQIFPGDMICIDRHHNRPHLTFVRKRKDPATPARLLEPNEFMTYVPARTVTSLEAVGL
jgi:ATP-dependent Clp protease ATP-binding subunit ClpA